MRSKPPSKTNTKKTPRPHGHARDGLPNASANANVNAYAAHCSAAPQRTATTSTAAESAHPPAHEQPPLTLPPLPLTATYTGTPEPPDTVIPSAPSPHNSHPSHFSYQQAFSHHHPADLELAALSLVLAAESALNEPEQEAYDLGLADGDQGFDDTTECPDAYLDAPHLREAYLNGHAIGVLNRRERERQPRLYACCDCRKPFNLHHRPAAECTDGELCHTCWEARGDCEEEEEEGDEVAWG